MNEERARAQDEAQRRTKWETETRKLEADKVAHENEKCVISQVNAIRLLIDSG